MDKLGGLIATVTEDLTQDMQTVSGNYKQYKLHVSSDGRGEFAAQTLANVHTALDESVGDMLTSLYSLIELTGGLTNLVEELFTEVPNLTPFETDEEKADTQLQDDEVTDTDSSFPDHYDAEFSK